MNLRKVGDEMKGTNLYGRKEGQPDVLLARFWAVENVGHIADDYAQDDLMALYDELVIKWED